MRFYIILAIAAFYLTGCATVARGTNDKMVVSTQPAMALVTTDKETTASKKTRKAAPEVMPVYYGCAATPCEFKVPRRSEFIMTITKDGFEDVEIGVDSGISKASLNANLAGSAGAGAVVGTATGLLVAGIGTSFGASGAAGAAIGTGLAAAAVVALPLVAISTIVDGSSGALLNVRPNPVVITLPPTGTKFKAHPKVQEIRDKRAGKPTNKGFRRFEKRCRSLRFKKLANGQLAEDNDAECAQKLLQKAEAKLDATETIKP